jgi:two-component system, sensor histidine kinase YesM
LFKIRKHPQQSIQGKMLRLVALTSIIPNLVLGVFAIFLILQSSASRVDQQLISNAMSARDIMTDIINTQQLDFEFWLNQEIINTYPTFAAMKLDESNVEVTMYQLVGNSQRTMSVYLVDESGAYIGTKHLPKSYHLPSFSKWGIYNDMNNSFGFIFSGGLNNEDVMQRSYSLGSKVQLQDGSYVYAIMDIAPGYIANQIKGLRNTSFGLTNFVMVNSNNIILYSDIPLNRGIKLFDEGLLSKSKEVKMVYDFVNDIKYYATFEADNLSNGALGLSVLIGSAILISGLLSFYNGIRYSKSLSDPIIELTDEIHSYQVSDFVDEKPTNKNEIEELRTQFRIMMTQRQKSTEELLEKQSLLKDAEFKSLSSQIQPHFLYNTLESIKWKAKLKETDDIVVMVSKLGEILKANMNLSESIVTIEQELRYIDSYLAIQKLRYGDRITSIVVIEEELYDLKIPKLILQPIVENAIIHGIEPLAEGGIIEVYGWASEANVYFTVFDNGIGSDFDFDEYIKSKGPKSIGLVNVDRRLQLYFGENYKMTWESTMGVGTIVHLKIPRREVIEDV